jgi:hypothetical protein
MIFAAAVLLTVGILQILEGIVALANDEFYVVGREYTFEFDITTWGWIHLLIGIVLALVGGFLFTGSVWARWAGIGVAVFSMISNFMWLPYYPFWAIVIIALNIAVIWALAVVEVPGDLERRPG